MCCVRLADEIFDDCLRAIGEELDTINADIVQNVYSTEFAAPDDSQLRDLVVLKTAPAPSGHVTLSTNGYKASTVGGGSQHPIRSPASSELFHKQPTSTAKSADKVSRSSDKSESSSESDHPVMEHLGQDIKLVEDIAHPADNEERDGKPNKSKSSSSPATGAERLVDGKSSTSKSEVEDVSRNSSPTRSRRSNGGEDRDRTENYDDDFETEEEIEINEEDVSSRHDNGDISTDRD